MENERITFKVSAHEYYGKVGLEATARLEWGSTKADAQAVAAQFPKSAKVKGTTLSGYIGPNEEYGTIGFVSCRVIFERNGVTGEFNETGLRRYRSFRRAAEKLGFVTEWARYSSKNALDTEADFESYLTQEA